MFSFSALPPLFIFPVLPRRAGLGRGAGRGRARPLFPSPGAGGCGGWSRGSGGAARLGLLRRCETTAAGDSGSASERRGRARRRRTEKGTETIGTREGNLKREGKRADAREGRKEERMGRGARPRSEPRELGMWTTRGWGRLLPERSSFWSEGARGTRRGAGGGAGQRGAAGTQRAAECTLLAG